MNYNVDKSKGFFNCNLCVLNFVVSLNVVAGTGERVHNNRSNYGLAYNAFGTKVYKFKDGEALRVKDNELIFLPKYSDYVVDVETPGDCYAINFELNDDLILNPFLLAPKRTTEIIGIFKNTEKLWRTKPIGYYESCCSELYRLISMIKCEKSLAYMPKSKEKIIMPAIKYIHENYTDKMSVPYIAKLCGISQVYLRKIFNNAYGMSPARYIIKMRLERAVELINSKMYTLDIVSQMSGFFDYSYFSRQFKKEYGVCPEKFEDTISDNST